MTELLIENGQIEIPLEDAVYSLLKQCVEETLEQEDFPFDAEVNLTLTDDAEIQELNRVQRGIDRPTDVLSFPLLEQDEDGTLLVYDEDMAGGRVLLGDIVISAQRAAAQAGEYGHSLERELGFLTVHSMLHLLGYDHERGGEEEQEMFEKQEAILLSVGLVR